MAPTPSAPPVFGVALKWVPLHVEVDPLTGAVDADDRFAGCSAADRAALEWALRLADATGGSVIAATAGPVAAEALLRDALACGAARAVRIDSAEGAPSQTVATALATGLADADVICCGDHSLDRGTGSVPAFLAAQLGRPQALGLVRVEVQAPTTEAPGAGAPTTGAPTAVTATRRLDYGRREVLRVTAPAVLSFEGGTAELRRAALSAVLTARTAEITVVPWPGHPESPVRVTRRAPYRPRPRALAPPSAELSPRERILSLTGALGDRTPPKTVVAGTDEAADLVLEQLRTWGYLG
jgi:electron transfer flavoprotein beta subunit